MRNIIRRGRIFLALIPAACAAISLACAPASPAVLAWTKTIDAGQGSSQFYRVALAPDGAVYAAGHVQNAPTCDFGNGVTAQGTGDNFNAVLVKYDALGTPLWAASVLAKDGPSTFQCLAVGKDGSAYAAGVIAGTTRYDLSDSIWVAGKNNLYSLLLAKYSSDGKAQWAKTAASGENDFLVSGLAISPDGFIYLTADIIGNAPFHLGNGVIAQGPSLEKNALIVKFDAAGKALWARTFAHADSITHYNNVTVAVDGSVYAAGWLSQIISSDVFKIEESLPVESAYKAGSNALLVKYDPNGRAQWASTPTEAYSDSRFFGVTTGGDGAVYITGMLGGNKVFRFGDKISALGQSPAGTALLMKYDAAGAPRWIKSVSSPGGYSMLMDIAADEDDSLYLCGALGGLGPFAFDPDLLVSGLFEGKETMMLAAYDSSGKALWVEKPSACAGDSGLASVAAAAPGVVYLAGQFQANVTLGPVTITGSSPDLNALILKYEAPPPPAEK